MKITSKLAKLELERRKQLESPAKPLVLEDNFPTQNAFVMDTARSLVAQCSRRAGKSNGLALRFFRTLEKYPKCQCIYLGLTQESAREIMWPVLQELNEKYNIGCRFVESKMLMIHPNGAKLKLMGADLKNFIKRLKGRKYPGIAIDEAQDFGAHLQSLVDDVLTPSTADYEDGWLALTGTPGPVPQGYFFEITQNRRFGYSFHNWTLYDNPHMPNPREFVEEIKQKREWDDNNPTLLREYYNKWVLDVESLWIRYKEKLNNYAEVPQGKYNYILGIDIGYRDADALAVLAWNEQDPVTYLVEEVITPKQGLTELVEQVQALYAKYTISKAVIDEGGLGKKLAEEMRRRHAIPVQPADKARKQENVELLNDHLRRSKFKARKDSRFAQDSYLVQIDWDKSTPDRIVVKKKPHSDIIDAVLYAFKESPAWTHREKAPEPAYGSKAWGKREAEKLFEEALDHFTAQAELDKAQGNMGFGDD